MASQPRQANRPLRNCLFAVSLPLLLPRLIIAALICGERSKNFQRSEGVQYTTARFEPGLDVPLPPIYPKRATLVPVRAWWFFW
jgi:hypothetical protein